MRPSQGVLGTGHRSIATRWVDNTGASKGRSAKQVHELESEGPCGRADRRHCVEPATAQDRSTTHAPARTLGLPGTSRRPRARGPHGGDERRNDQAPPSTCISQSKQTRRISSEAAHPYPTGASPHANGTRPFKALQLSAERDGARGGKEGYTLRLN